MNLKGSILVFEALAASSVNASRQTMNCFSALGIPPNDELYMLLHQTVEVSILDSSLKLLASCAVPYDIVLCTMVNSKQPEEIFNCSLSITLCTLHLN
jgi:hypothetical protein